VHLKPESEKIRFLQKVDTNCWMAQEATQNADKHFC
jgi:hypothetical protein